MQTFDFAETIPGRVEAALKKEAVSSGGPWGRDHASEGLNNALTRLADNFVSQFPSLNPVFQSKLGLVQAFPQTRRIVARVQADFRHNRRGYLRGEYVIFTPHADISDIHFHII